MSNGDELVWPELRGVTTTKNQLPNPNAICSGPSRLTEEGREMCMRECNSFRSGQTIDLIALMLTEVWMLTTNTNRDRILDAIVRVAMNSQNEWVKANTPEHTYYSDPYEVRNVLGFIIDTHRPPRPRQ